MLLPNQINNQRFSSVGKGGYRASEVDAFIQRVFQNYNKLYNENNVLKERFASITPLIDEYNENKKSIADALIWAKSTSDKTVAEAQLQAKELVDAANAEAERIIAEKSAEARAVYEQELNSAKKELEQTKKELEATKNQAEAFSEKYVAEINAKAASVIEDANKNASQIVADAYKDAQTARDKADEIISKANEEIASLRAEALKLKKEIEKAVKFASKAAAEISVEEIAAEAEEEKESITARQIDIDTIEEFTLDSIQAEEDAPADDADEKEDNVPLFVETVIDEVSENADESKASEEDFISGGINAANMPDVTAYISKIFDSAGTEDADFSSFADGLNDAFAHSLEESDITFEDLKKVMENTDKGEDLINEK